VEVARDAGEEEGRGLDVQASDETTNRRRRQLGSRKALERWRLKLSGRKFAGVRSNGRRWREEEDEVVRKVKKWK
jgi:hypothetical protein